MNEEIRRIREEIMAHQDNQAYGERGWQPLFAADERARIVVVGHAPGRRTQELGIPWSDASGRKLMDWLGLDEAEFRDGARVSQLPMDFYYQGKGKSGDLPPRKGFAPLWHQRLLAQMPLIRLTVLIGAYAQAYYLGARRKGSLTATVRAFGEYLPDFFPLVHPSPLNFRWQARNPWFEHEVIPRLRERVREVLEGSGNG